MTVRGEPTWQPISALPTIAMLIDEGLRDARERYRGHRGHRAAAHPPG